MIESGGIHEPLLIYIGTEPSRSEGSREKRKAKALEKLAAKRAAKKARPC